MCQKNYHKNTNCDINLGKQNSFEIIKKIKKNRKTGCL